MIVIELFEEGDRLLLTLALGMATGLAMKENPLLAQKLLVLANCLHLNNPNWRPYVVGDQKGPTSE